VPIEPRSLFQRFARGHDGCGHHAQVGGSVDDQFEWRGHRQSHPSRLPSR